MEDFERVAKEENEYCDAHKDKDVKLRTAIRVDSLRVVMIEQTRYLASLQTEANKTLRQIAASLETQNELLTRLLHKMEGAGEAHPESVLSQSTSAHKRSTTE